MLVVVQKRPDLFQEGGCRSDTGPRTLSSRLPGPKLKSERLARSSPPHSLTLDHSFIAVVGDVVIDSEGEQVASEAAPAVNPMLPPLKFTLEHTSSTRDVGARGRAHRSRGAASSAEDGGAPVRVGVDAPTADERGRHWPEWTLTCEWCGAVINDLPVEGGVACTGQKCPQTENCGAKVSIFFLSIFLLRKHQQKTSSGLT